MRVLVLFSVVLALGFATAQPLTLGEQYLLRGYTGNAMGKVWAGALRFEGVEVLTNSSSICASLSGAAIASYLEARPNASVATAALSSPDDVLRLVSFRQPALALIFGGQTDTPTNNALVKAVLAEAAQRNYGGAIFIHVRTWGLGSVGLAAKEDASIRRYLSGKNNLFAVLVDGTAGEVRVAQVRISTAGDQEVAQVLGTQKMSETWLTLFRRSL
ncbi:MAG: hypothetical protein RMK51_00155 [Meiothermus sp.]|uniref:hypothetical protein n=1 Tax=Meiothermus sp. TaxID=1955249 RepID=UPI0025F99317|nr:hypothetical protein [Meiothermus sp.]MCS7069781.1 hypothetical protein [Meiothermus sp.]MDW8424316.1 hypothetical protein [Meiothermus sp.]